MAAQNESHAAYLYSYALQHDISSQLQNRHPPSWALGRPLWSFRFTDQHTHALLQQRKMDLEAQNTTELSMHLSKIQLQFAAYRLAQVHIAAMIASFAQRRTGQILCRSVQVPVQCLMSEAFCTGTPGAHGVAFHSCPG